MAQTAQNLPIALVRLRPVNFRDRGRTPFKVTLNHPSRNGKRFTLVGGEDKYDGGWYTFYEDDGHDVVEFLRTRSAKRPTDSIEDLRYNPNLRDDYLHPLCDVIHIPPSGMVRQIDPDTGRLGREQSPLKQTVEAHMQWLREMAAMYEARNPFNATFTHAKRGSIANPYGLKTVDSPKDKPSDRQNLERLLGHMADGRALQQTVEDMVSQQLKPFRAVLSEQQNENERLRLENDRLQARIASLSGDPGDVSDGDVDDAGGDPAESAILSVGESSHEDDSGVPEPRARKKKRATSRRRKPTLDTRNALDNSSDDASSGNTSTASALDNG